MKSESLALSVLEDFAPEHTVIALEGGSRRRLNGAVVPDRHRYAVLNSEGETLATGRSRAAAIDGAAREALRRFVRQAQRDSYCLSRLRAATIASICEALVTLPRPSFAVRSSLAHRTIQTGGEE